MSRTISICTLFLAALLPVAASAQTPTPSRPIDPAPPIPVQKSAAVDAPLNPKLPTLFIVGDSTARNQANLGWGDHLAPLFDTTKINVANRAVAGRSSRTYYNEGRWDKVLAELKPGDFILLQMGHNDGGSSPESILKDPKSRGSIKGLGDETAVAPIKVPYSTGPLAGQATETIHTYGWYNRKYIYDAQAKGTTVILLTPTIRNIWKDGADGKPAIETDMGFRDFDQQLAAAEHIPLADMAALSAKRLQALGPEATATLYPVDHTHTSPEGADANAHDVVQSLRDIHSPLVKYMKQ